MNELLLALAGLPPMPRTPLTINPCPPGYSLQLVGGQFTCVLEEAEGSGDLLEMNQRRAMAEGQQRIGHHPAPAVRGGLGQTGGGG